MTKVTAFSLFHQEAKHPWISLPRGNLARRGPFGALSNSPRRLRQCPKPAIFRAFFISLFSIDVLFFKL